MTCNQLRPNSHRCPIGVTTGAVCHINYHVITTNCINAFCLHFLTSFLVKYLISMCVCAIINVTWCNNLLRNSKIFILFKCILNVQILLGAAVYNKSATFFLTTSQSEVEGKELPEQMFTVIMFGLIVFVI